MVGTGPLAGVLDRAGHAGRHLPLRTLAGHPTALTAATGTLHKLGLLLTRGHVLEGLNQIDTVIFDKTGTLTEGRLTLRAIRPLGTLDADQCLTLAAALESRLST